VVNTKLMGIVLLSLILLVLPIAWGLQNVGIILSGSHLFITDVDVAIDGKFDNNLQDGDLILEKVKPGSIAEFYVTVGNNYTLFENITIEIVEVEVIIESIDDFFDIEQISDEFDLTSGQEKTLNFSFDIPLQVEEDTYDVIIFADGFDANNTFQLTEVDLTLTVEKDLHNVSFLTSELDKTNLVCGESATLNVEIVNTGLSPETVTLDISNSELGISDRTENISLLNITFNDDEFQRLLTINTPKGIEEKTYPIDISVFDDNTVFGSESVDLLITECTITFLKISDLDVKVGGKSDKNLNNGDKISKEAKPGDKIEIKIEIENLFTDEEDLEIEDIEVEVIIEGIDDGDDLDDSKEFDLKADDNKKIKFNFEVPLEVDEDTYDIEIHVEGKDENGITHEIDWTLELEVEKEKHELRITESNLNPSEVSCNRNSRLDVEILNLGEDEEEDVRLGITNSNLGINIFERNIELETGIEDDASFKKTFSINLGDNVRSGIYPILIKAYYDDSELSDTKTAELSVNVCGETEITKKETKPKTKKSAKDKKTPTKTVQLKEELQLVQLPLANENIPTLEPAPEEKQFFIVKIFSWFFGLFS